MQIKVKTASAMEQLGKTLAVATESGSVIYLQGELGTGKTTFVRGFLRGLGYQDHVRSPTFNLLEFEKTNVPETHEALDRLEPDLFQN